MREKITVFMIFFVSIRAVDYESREENYSLCGNTSIGSAPYFPSYMSPEIVLVERECQDLMCPVCGEEPINFTWKKDSVDLNINTSKFEIERVTHQDEGNYTCQACNKFGCVNHTVRLYVERLKLEWRVSLENDTVKTGNWHIFQCKHNFPADEVTVQWYPHTAEQIIPNGEGQLTGEQYEKKSNVASDIYEIRNVTEEDEGWYLCLAFTRTLFNYSSAYLTVVPNDINGKESNYYASSLWENISLSLLIAVLFIFSRQMCRRIKRDQRDKMNNVTFNRTYPEQPDLEDPKKVLPELHPLFSIIVDNKLRQNCKIPKFSRDDIDLEEILGEGAFGIVRKALVKENLQSNTKTTVAVKMVNDNGNAGNGLADLSSEIEMMSRIGHHNNIIGFLGYCEYDSQLWVLMEYAALGNLRDFLRNSDLEGNKNSNGYTSLKKYTVKKLELLGFARQIAEAMEFLASKNCVHRDLAARNVLVTENRVMKVADFGLTRYTHNKEYYRIQNAKRGLPYKWTAPETFENNLHTTQSDVWSFGIVLWEITTMGDEPYGNMDNNEVCAEIKNNFRLEIPPICSEKTGDLMMKCWQEKPENRPSFSDISEMLKDTINDENETIEHLSEHRQVPEHMDDYEWETMRDTSISEILYDKELEFGRGSFQLMEKIGEAAFGIAYSESVEELWQPNTSTTVAVVMPENNRDDEDLRNWVSETR